MIGNFQKKNKKFYEKSRTFSGNPASQQAKPACSTRPGRPASELCSRNASDRIAEIPEKQRECKLGGVEHACGAPSTGQLQILEAASIRKT